MSTPEDRLARVALARAVEPGSLALWSALQARPAEQVWEGLRRGEPLDGFGQQALAGITGRLQAHDPQRDLERLGDLGGRVVCPGDEEWPDSLDWHPAAMTGETRQMAPPQALFVLGQHGLAGTTGASVSVVGARAATVYGTHVATELAFALAEAGQAVVSGGAYGIDGAAHRGALDAASAPTVAVLAGGVDVPYPRGNTSLLQRVVEAGLVVSEVPPGCAPTRVRFLVRNRLIAALSQGTVVVEAAARSGSLSTANRALDLGRPVMAVPGPVTSPLSAGCHELVRAGKATLVGEVAHVLEVVGRMGEHLVAPLRGPRGPRDGLDEAVRRILDAVPVRQPAGVASIARTAGVSALVVQRALPALLVAGLVEQRDGAWRLSGLGAGR